MGKAVETPGDMILRVAQAMTNHDCDELLSFYERDAVLVKADGSEARGHAGIRADYETYRDKVVSMTAEAVWIHIVGEIATVRGKYTITFKRNNGELLELTGSPIEVLRRQSDGSWLYVIDNGGGANPLAD
jgi:ketosteroid isomerase-like protein